MKKTNQNKTPRLRFHTPMMKALYNTIKDLHKAGSVSDETLKEFYETCVRGALNAKTK